MPHRLNSMDKMVAPPAVVRALKRGLEYHKMGLAGDGLEAGTVDWAKKLVNGDPVSSDKVKQAVKWWGRNERFLKEDDKTPAGVSALLWGGASGRDWFKSMGEEVRHESAEEKMPYKDKEDES